MSSPLNPNLPADLPPIGLRRVVYLQANRAPTTSDSKYRSGAYYEFNTEWRDTSASPNPDVWKLVAIRSATNAIWIKLSSGSSGPMLMILPPSGLSPIVPDSSGNVTFTSTGGTIQITGVTGPGAGDHTVNFDLTGGAVAIEKIQGDDGVNVIPSSGIVKTFGAVVTNGTHAKPVFFLRKSATTDTEELDVQVAKTVTGAPANANDAGLVSAESTQFVIDVNGYMTLKGTGNIFWQTVSTNQSLVKANGYMCIAPGGALTMALPAAANTAIGDTIEILLDGATSFQVTQSDAAHRIRYGNTQTTLGAGGSLTTTLQGDWIQLIAQTSTRWVANSPSGNFTVV